jgi:hypothetical protein
MLKKYHFKTDDSKTITPQIDMRQTIAIKLFLSFDGNGV